MIIFSKYLDGLYILPTQTFYSTNLLTAYYRLKRSKNLRHAQKCVVGYINRTRRKSYFSQFTYLYNSCPTPINYTRNHRLYINDTTHRRILYVRDKV